MPHPNFCPDCPPTSITYIVGPEAPGPNFTFDFEIEIDAADIVVSILPDGQPDTPTSWIVQVEDTDYDLDRQGMSVNFLPGQEPSTGDTVRIERCTDSIRIVDYQAGSTLTAETINFENIQQFYLIQELCNELDQIHDEIGEQVGPQGPPGEPGAQGEPGPPGEPGDPGDTMTVARISAKQITGTGAGGDRHVTYTCIPQIWNTTTNQYQNSGAPQLTGVINRDESRRHNAQHFGIMLQDQADTSLDVIVEIIEENSITPPDSFGKINGFHYRLPTTFPVSLTVTNDPAGQGDATTQCSFTYNVFDAEGNQILTAVAPLNFATQRPSVGAMDPATDGIGAWDETTMTMYLLRAFETPQVEECPTQQI